MLINDLIMNKTNDSNNNNNNNILLHHHHHHHHQAVFYYYNKKSNSKSLAVRVECVRYPEAKGEDNNNITVPVAVTVPVGLTVIPGKSLAETAALVTMD